MLTDPEIKSAIKAATKDTLLSDGTEGKGSGSLKLRIRPSTRPGEPATATWVASYIMGGKRYRETMGFYGDPPGLSLKAARARYNAKYRAHLGAGTLPAVALASAAKIEAKAEEAATRTVERLFAGTSPA